MAEITVPLVIFILGLVGLLGAWILGIIAVNLHRQNQYQPPGYINLYKYELDLIRAIDKGVGPGGLRPPPLPIWKGTVSCEDEKILDDNYRMAKEIYQRYLKRAEDNYG